jgi:general secretion pathway protein A
MYYQHFNLSGPPFQFTPSPDVLYPSKSHREALAALEWGVLHEPSGLTLLIGEPGTGKTTLISSVLARHLEHVRIVYIANPRLSFDEILQIIARQLGIVFNSPQRLARLDALDEFLVSHCRSERVTVIIDEAQVLPDRVLEELRLLSNCTPLRPNALRFIFVGQTEFLRRLESSNLRQLNDRIGARAMLNALGPNEIQEYIDFRLRACSGSARDVFTSSALKIVADHSGGIPRRINVLCHNAMLLAYTSESTRVRGQHATAAAAEYEDLFVTATSPRTRNSPAEKPKLQWGSAAVVAALGAVVLGVGFRWSLTAYSHRDRKANVGARSPAADLGRPGAKEPPPRMESASNSSGQAGEGAASAPSGTVLISEPSAKGASHTSQPHLREIRVKVGDTVAEIAQRYLGSRQKLGAVIAANPQLANVDRIFPGDVIYLPQRDSSDPSEQ